MRSKIALAFTAATVFATLPFSTSFAQEMAKPTAEMQAVLDKLGALGAKPFSTLSVPEARTQASPADAAHAVQWESASLPTLKHRSPPRIS